jgi:hypothetical protein
MRKGILLLAILWALMLVTSCQVGDSGSNVGGRWKTFSQLKADLRAITRAGYSRVCLFDLRDIRDYPDPRYVSLLKQYADDGLEITIYVQQIEPEQATLELVQSIGASSVILYESDLLDLFSRAAVTTFWWSGVAYPPNHADYPDYFGWPDLRNEGVRQGIADWASQVPQEVDGGLSLDYIRWNEVGNGRTAEQVTDLLQRIKANWDMVGRGTLSAAVYPYLGKGPENGGALSVGQEWDGWLEQGLLDFVYPMAYISEDIPDHIKEWASYDASRIVPCLSVAHYD